MLSWTRFVDSDVRLAYAGLWLPLRLEQYPVGGVTLEFKPAESSEGADVINKLLLIVGVVIVAVSSVRAQSTGLSGRVVDEQGGLVSGAKITLTSLDTALKRAAVSDEQGRFQFAAVTSFSEACSARSFS